MEAVRDARRIESRRGVLAEEKRRWGAGKAGGDDAEKEGARGAGFGFTAKGRW
jgi:hypothetical protein